MLGTFDVVLYLGVLYHMRDPLRVLQRLRAVTKEVAIIESHARFHADTEDRTLCEFVQRNELNDDWTNWWVPNERALVALCRAAGFRRVQVHQGRPTGLGPEAGAVDYRIIAHAYP